MSTTVIGVDIGGSHITCIGVDPADHAVRTDLQIRQEIDRHGSAEKILHDWSATLEQLIRQIGRENLAGIGFAMPGPFDYPQGIALFQGVKKYDNLFGVNVRAELKQRLGLAPEMPVRFLNDATCFAVGEAWIGKGAGLQKVVAVTLGTGFGSAFITDGIPVETGPDVPEFGCVYHLSYREGIANDYFSTTWFHSRYKEVTGKDISEVKEMAAAASSGTDPDAAGIFEEFGAAMGTFIAPWLRRFGAECMVIGGNIANSYELFEVPLNRALAEGQAPVPVFATELGELAAIAGAARLCDDSFYSRLPFFSGK
ncbi:MAG: ROK family protein [Bacteroidetes bacterium]|nr:ROK family protein [Bacteroidota bacterium]